MICRSLHCLTAHQLLPEMTEAISEARAVFFIDAEISSEPGQIKRRTIDPAATTDDVQTHHFTPSGLLTVANLLYGRCPPATLITIGGKVFDEPDRLSPVVETAVAKVIAALEQEIRKMQ